VVVHDASGARKALAGPSIRLRILQGRLPGPTGALSGPLAGVRSN